MKTNDNKNSGKSNIIFEFDDNRIVKIKSECGRGATCISYTCEITFKDNPEKVVSGIIKEFAPKRFDYQPFELKDGLPQGMYRVLPSQKEDFIKEFDDFKESMDNVNRMLNELTSNDRSLYRHYNSSSIYNDKENVKFEINEAKNAFRGLFLLPYDGKDFDKCIAEHSIEERIKVLSTLCLLVDKFHEQDLVLVDLKPENFLYEDNGITPCLKLFDFDSVVKVNDRGKLLPNQELSGTNFFTAAEVFETNRNVREHSTGKRADVYSIGAMLAYFITYEFIGDDLRKSKEKNWQRLLNNVVFNNVHSKDENVTVGFWNRFTEIVEKATNIDITLRYKETGNISLMRQIQADLTTLLDIYTHKGIHPEVMLDSANKLAERFKEDSLKDFNPDLLCETVEVN